MKIYLLILACLLLSCDNSSDKHPIEILSEAEFGAVLKDIHLEDALLDLKQTNQTKNLRNHSTNLYFQIYSKHKISEKKFNASLDYYCENPEKLETIYTTILNELSKEQSNYNLP